MKGRNEISDAAAVALVKAYKKYELHLSSQSDERTQPHFADGWQRLRQIWAALTDELNAQFGITITTEQWKKKISNIKTNLKTKKGNVKRDGKVSWSLAELEYDQLFGREGSTATNFASSSDGGGSGDRSGTTSATPFQQQQQLTEISMLNNYAQVNKRESNDASDHIISSMDELLCNVGGSMGCFLNNTSFDSAATVNVTSDSKDFNLNTLLPSKSDSLPSENGTVAKKKRLLKRSMAPSPNVNSSAPPVKSATNGTTANIDDSIVSADLQRLYFMAYNHQLLQSQQGNSLVQPLQFPYFLSQNNGAFNSNNYYNSNNGASGSSAQQTAVRNHELQLQNAAQLQMEAATIQKNASEKLLAAVERFGGFVTKFESFFAAMEAAVLLATTSRNRNNEVVDKSTETCGSKMLDAELNNNNNIGSDNNNNNCNNEGNDDNNEQNDSATK